MDTSIEPVALHEAARHRYLSYALSVITSRALPDVRDGLKPVQRRILYAMYNNLHLTPDGRYRKSAAIVGEVMAKFHPHGDQAIYDAMVRMAQPFSLLHTLVDGQGNFGSLDGDPPAAYRYTEAKLRKLAVELLEELKKQTVPFRPNYDGQAFEPVVLPARYPQLLVGGCEGIAVGMATRIPPHNLREVIDAVVTLIEDPEADSAKLCRKVKGPDFPTGGLILTPPDEIREIYETGGGSVTVQGEWTTEKRGRKTWILIHSIPYSVNKAKLLEKIGQHITERKLPQVLDVRDESTDDIRIAMELRRPEDEQPAMAYLFKYTPLQQAYHVNLTCLVPTENPEVGAPAKLDLRGVLTQWLDFRRETVRRRFEYELHRLRERIHVLEGFEIIFDLLDEAIRIIRRSEGRRDAAEKLMDRFDLDDLQADAILQLRLYKLAKLEILAIRKELYEARAEAARIEAILASATELMGVIKDELLAIRKEYGQRRRTNLGGEEEVLEFSEADYIVAEDTFVIITRDGWFKRQSSFTDLSKIRIRDGDSIAWLFRAGTRSTVTFLTDQGGAYTIRVDDVPATTGYGDPIQKFFNYAAGERVVGVVSHDPRNQPPAPEGPNKTLYGIAVTSGGRGLRFPLEPHAEISTKSGRRYIRLEKGDAVLAAYVCAPEQHVSLATEGGNMLTYPAEEMKALTGVGKGVQAIKLTKGDRVIAFELTRGYYEGAHVLTNNGREEIARPSKHAGSRGGKGSAVIRRGSFTKWLQQPSIDIPGDEQQGGK
jgi:DNA gyrase subunit A